MCADAEPVSSGWVGGGHNCDPRRPILRPRRRRGFGHVGGRDAAAEAPQLGRRRSTPGRLIVSAVQLQWGTAPPAGLGRLVRI